MNTVARPTAFFRSSYAEALALTKEARDYVQHHEARDFSELAPVARIVAACEAMRVTSRLTQVMAWLLAQRAVGAGEITAEAMADERYRLAGQAVCLAEPPPLEQPLPQGLTSLLARSLALYQRVERMDRMITRGVQLDGRGETAPH